MSAVGKGGVRRVGARLASALILSLFGAFATPAMATPARTFSVVVPVVSVQSGNDLVTVEELTAATTPGGIWSVLADSAINHGATLAIDSRIVASITALGEDVPVVVSSWIDRVTRSQPLYLPWGNADPFVLASFASSYRVSTIALSKISGVPALEIVGWPTGNAGTDRSVKRVQTLGFTTVIVDDQSFPGTRGALSSDIGELVAVAVSPGSTTDLETVSQTIRQNYSEGAVFSLPRNPRDIDSARAAEFLDTLFSGSFAAAAYTPVATSSIETFTPGTVPVRAIRTLAGIHRTDQRVSAIAADPSVISTPRLRRLSVLAGTVGNAEFVSDVRGYARTADSFGEFITFTVGADFTVLADSADLPLTVSNSSESEITVVATVNAVSGIVSIATPQQTITVPAESSVQVTVPMSSVTNGQTALRATLTTIDGIPITEPAYIAIAVQAQWEGLTLIGFIAVVSTILTIGIVRTIRDRRKRT